MVYLPSTDNLINKVDLTPVAPTNDVAEMAGYVRSREGRDAIEAGLLDVQEGRTLEGKGVLLPDIYCPFINRWYTCRMTSTSHVSREQDTIVVPVVSLEEVSKLTTEERNRLIAELKETEAAMEAGAFEEYSPEWLRQRFEAVRSRPNA